MATQKLNQQQLEAAFKPMIAEMIKATTEAVSARMDAHYDQLMLQLKELKAQNDLLLSTMNTPKKAIQRTPKEGAPVAEGGAEPLKKFANRMVWTRYQYKTSQEFRDKFTTQAARDEITASAEKMAGKTPESRLGAEGNIVYNHLKNNEALMAEITALYEQHIKAFDEKQVIPEEETPKK